jgi:hypothetical protein
MAPLMLLRITAPHFVAGVVVDGRMIVRAAPILQWSVGRSVGFLTVWARGKGYIVESFILGEKS